MIPTTSEITVESPALADPFQLPLTASSGLLNFGGVDRAGPRQFAKICGECLAKAAKVADSHMGNRVHRSVGQKCKARIGPADVCE
jgi:hypothetical protein